MAQHPCRVWDFTCHAGHFGGELPDTEEFIEHLKTIDFRRYIFQYEEGEENKTVHIQGKIWLKKKTRRPDLKANLRPTAKPNLNKIDYVTKEETRVKGPFDSREIAPNIYWRHKEALENQYPWQETLMEEIKNANDRTIIYVHETKGMTGKTTWAAAMDMSYKAVYFNIWNEPKEIMEQVYAEVEEYAQKPLLLFDLPRAGLTRDRKAQCMRYVEAIKAGKIVDPRHSFKKKWIFDPVIVVFSNEDPEAWIHMQSRDRWVIIDIEEDKTATKRDF